MTLLSLAIALLALATWLYARRRDKIEADRRAYPWLNAAHRRLWLGDELDDRISR